jgi:hypothetical protein
VVVCFVDIGGINYQHCWEVAVYFVDIAGINDHYFLEVFTETLNDMENRQQMTTNMFKFSGNTMS